MFKALNNEKNIYLIILFITVSLCCFYLKMKGIKYGFDSKEYINIADNIASLKFGKIFSSFKNWGYLFYPTIISFCQIISFKTIPTNYSIVLFQILLLGLANIFLYKTFRLFNLDKNIALILILISCITMEIFQWSIYLLSDSSNLSLIIICNYYLIKIALRWDSQEVQPKDFFILVPLVIFAFSRPTNYPYIGLCLSLLFYQYPISQKKKLTIMTIGFISVASFLVFSGFLSAFSSETEKLYGFLNNRTKGIVIIDRHLYDTPLSTHFFILHLYIKRLIYFWAISLDGYSRLHSMANYLSLTPAYLVGFTSVVLAKHVKRFKSFYLFTLLIVIGYWLFHTLTIIDYDFRYRITVLPFILILGSISISEYLQSQRKNHAKNR